MICSAYTALPFRPWCGLIFVQSIVSVMRWKALPVAMGKKRQVVVTRWARPWGAINKGLRVFHFFSLHIF
jgi:hypothetical protein